MNSETSIFQDRIIKELKYVTGTCKTLDISKAMASCTWQMVCPETVQKNLSELGWDCTYTFSCIRRSLAEDTPPATSETKGTGSKMNAETKVFCAAVLYDFKTHYSFEHTYDIQRVMEIADPNMDWEKVDIKDVKIQASKRNLSATMTKDGIKISGVIPHKSLKLNPNHQTAMNVGYVRLSDWGQVSVIGGEFSYKELSQLKGAIDHILTLKLLFESGMGWEDLEQFHDVLLVANLITKETNT